MKRNNRKNHQKSDVYKIPNKIVFSPTSNVSSEKNKNDTEVKNLTENNKNQKFDIGHLIDKIFTDDFIIIALIGLLIYEVINLKKENADNDIIFEYEIMIAALIYIYF